MPISASSVRIEFIIVSVSLAQIGRSSAMRLSIANPASSSLGPLPAAIAPMGMMYDPIECEISGSTMRPLSSGRQRSAQLVGGFLTSLVLYTMPVTGQIGGSQQAYQG